MKAYKKKAKKNLVFGDTLILSGEYVYISEGFREGSYAKDLVKIFDENRNYLGKFVKDNIGYYKNFK